MLVASKIANEVRLLTWVLALSVSFRARACTRIRYRQCHPVFYMPDFIHQFSIID
jgi:hypothetical protein